MSAGGGLIPLETINAVEVFTGPNLDELLAKIRAEVVTVVPDVLTAAGRKEIASRAYKVARSKTTIDDAGKTLVEDQKNQIKVVDARRKHARDYLDALRDEVRKPLDDWEAEQARIERDAIEAAEAARAADEAERQRAIAEREAEVVSREAELAAREAATAAKEKQIADAAAAAQAELDRAAREETIRQDATARAEQEAADAIANAERAAAAAQEAAIAAAAKAVSDQAEAVRQAEERAAREAATLAASQAAEAARVKAEDDARAADREHRKTVNNKALAALVKAGIETEAAKQIITLIASGSVPGVSIHY